MRHEWKSGDVALVNDTTTPDAPWRPATCQASAVKGESEAVWVLHDSGTRVWGSVSLARPLVVIDPEDREQVERLVRLFDGEVVKSDPVTVLDDDLRDMQAALREFANPTPPKPDEPTGLGAVVEDDKGERYTRYDRVSSLPWWHDYNGADAQVVVRRYAYSDFRAVRILSEGVTP